MESHRHASGASDHSENIAGSHEQHCSQMPQQMIYNTSSQGLPRHVSGHSHVLPQQTPMVVPQQYITSEQNAPYGQVQRTLSDHPSASSALAGEASLHGQLMPSVQPNVQTYSEVKPHQRHNGSHELAPVYGNMSGPAMSMPGQVHHSPKAVHQTVEGIIVSGHIPGGDGHVPHGGYYPVPYQGQHMPNSGQISWQSPRQFMSRGGQGGVSGQVFVSGVQARFNSQVSVPFRGQHSQYALNQEYGDVYYQQHHPVYGELNSGSPRGTFPPQQHCVGPNGQRIMFARPPMHAPRHHPRMPADAQFVYYAPHTVGGASQQLSPSWSGSTQMMRSGVPVRYCNQQAWQRPVAVAYGSPLPGHRMPDYHLSPESRMTAEFCDNFAGARQRSPPSHSFSPGSVRCYRPSSVQGVHAGMMCVDDKYAGTCHVQADRNPNIAVSSQDFVSPVVTSTIASTASMCSTACSDISPKDSAVLTHTTTPSHPLEHVPDGRTALSLNSAVNGTAPSSLSSYNHPGYYLQGTNANGSWSVSAAGEYYDYNATSQYAPRNQHAVRHVNPYNYYASPPNVPYSGTPHYPQPGCGYPCQSHAEGVHWQGQEAEHPLRECRSVLPDKVVSHQHLEQESLTVVTTTPCCVSATVTCSAVSVSSPVFLTSAPISSVKVDKQNFENADSANTVAIQSSAAHAGHRMPFPSSLYPAKDHNASAVTSLSCSPLSQVIATATGTAVTLPVSTVDSTSVLSNDAAVPSADSGTLFGQDKRTEDVVAGTTGTESHNCLQITSSSALSSTWKSAKAPKRSGSRKGTTKTKKKKPSQPLDTGEFCTVTCANAVKCDLDNGLYSSSDRFSTDTTTKTAPRAESVDSLYPVTSNCLEQTAVVVPYGWRRHVDSGTVVYYRL